MFRYHVTSTAADDTSSTLLICYLYVTTKVRAVPLLTRLPVINLKGSLNMCPTSLPSSPPTSLISFLSPGLSSRTPSVSFTPLPPSSGFDSPICFETKKQRLCPQTMTVSTRVMMKLQPCSAACACVRAVLLYLRLYLCVFSLPQAFLLLLFLSVRLSSCDNGLLDISIIGSCVQPLSRS